jgi:hypothetical protein
MFSNNAEHNNVQVYPMRSALSQFINKSHSQLTEGTLTKLVEWRYASQSAVVPFAGMASINGFATTLLKGDDWNMTRDFFASATPTSKSNWSVKKRGVITGSARGYQKQLESKEKVIYSWNNLHQQIKCERCHERMVETAKRLKKTEVVKFESEKNGMFFRTAGHHTTSKRQ